MRDEATGWAREEFGDAALGDVRRTHRLVALTAAVARRPAGTVTQVLDDAAEREGAYRFLESHLVWPRPPADASRPRAAPAP